MKRQESALEAMYYEASDQVKNKIHNELENLSKKGVKASVSEILTILQNNLENDMVQKLDSSKIIGYMVMNDDGKSMPSLEIDYIDQYKNKMDELFKTKVLNKVNGFPSAFDQICDFLDKVDNIGTVSVDILDIIKSGIESDKGDNQATVDMLSKVFDLVSDVSGIVLPKGINVIGIEDGTNFDFSGRRITA